MELAVFSSKFSNVRTELMSGDCSRISPMAVCARITCLVIGVRMIGVALDVVQGEGGSVVGCLSVSLSVMGLEDMM
jgi:hypothetical protein